MIVSVEVDVLITQAKKMKAEDCIVAHCNYGEKFTITAH